MCSSADELIKSNHVNYKLTEDVRETEEKTITHILSFTEMFKNSIDLPMKCTLFVSRSLLHTGYPSLKS